MSSRPALRVLAPLPLLVVAPHVLHYLRLGTPEELLWFCHLGNLLMAAGLLLEAPWVIRVALVAELAGLVPWGIYCALEAAPPWSSVLSHLGGIAVGLVALARVRASPGTWWRALGAFLLVQGLCRLGTDPAANINVAHRVRPEAAAFFSQYWQYWFFLMGFTAALLWGADRLLRFAFPPRDAASPGRGIDDGDRRLWPQAA